MRPTIFILILTMVGCVQTVPTETTPATRTVTRITRAARTEVRVYGEVMSVEVVEGPVHTWMTPDDIEKMEEERHKKLREQGLECWPGDPLCADLGGTPVQMNGPLPPQ
jgi:hypothetical protein